MICHICNTQYQRYLYGTFVGMVHLPLLTLFYFPHSEGQMYSEELRNIVKSGIAAAVVGMVYGGLPGARHARERFIQLSQAEIYQNRVDAVVRQKEQSLKYMHQMYLFCNIRFSFTLTSALIVH